MITRLFTEINEKMDEVGKILKDNNYFTNLEKRIEEYNNKMMSVYNNEATEYINRIDKAIEYIEQNKYRETNEYNDTNEQIVVEAKHLLDILKGSDNE